MSEISYNYSSDGGYAQASYANEYNAVFSRFPRHVIKESFNIDTKVEMEEATKLVKDIIARYEFKNTLSSTTRGLSVADYEDEDEDGEGFERVQDSKYYVDYIYMFRAYNQHPLGASVYYINGGHHILQLSVTYDRLEDVSTAQELFDELTKAFRKYKKEEEEKSKVNFICQSQSGLYLNEMTLRKNVNFDIDMHYNDDFIAVHDHIIESLNKKNGKGIVFLHGKHGTGKTTYLRHLIHSLGKNIIYVSPDMSARVADPSFLPFLMKHKNSILIIEDAENVIKTREAGENQAVSNLLNVTDGILGDGLNFQIICTFNTGFENIDPALKRKGRMIAQYEFNNLSKEKTRALVHDLYGEEVEPMVEKMSLAEIFNMQEDNFENVPEKKQKIGFV